MIRLVVFFLLAILLSACGVDKGPVNIDLTGAWDIVVAKRDGKLTKSLDQAQINIIDSTRLYSNLFTADDTVAYEMTSSELVVHADPPMQLSVRDMSTDTLAFKARLNNHRYDMIFVRANK